MIIARLLLSHRREVGPFCDDSWALARLEIARRVCTLQRLLRLDARYCTAIARIELAPVKLAVVLHDAWGPGRYSLAGICALNVQISPAAGHGIARTFPVKVYIDLGNRTSTTVLAFVVQTLPFTLSKRLLLLVL